MRHPNRHSMRRLAPVAVLVTVMALVAGCGGNGVSELPKAKAPSSSPTPTDSGVTAEGVDPSDLDVIANAGNSPGVNLSFGSPIYTVKAAAEPTQPTKVTLLLDNALPRTVPVFVATRPAAGQPWTYLPAHLMSDQRHVQFTTTHFSDFAVLVMDLDGAVQSLKDAVHSRLDFGIDKKVKKPECADPKEARKDGYFVGATKGRKTVYWCFGYENGKRVVKVVNRRVQPLQVAHLKVPVLAPAVDVPKVWNPWIPVVGDQATFLPPGKTVTYDADLEPTKRLLLTATNDANAQSMRALQAMTAAVVARQRAFGAGKHTTIPTMAALLARPQCAKTIGQGSDKMLAGCFSKRKIMATVGNAGLLLSKITSDPSVKLFLRDEFKAMALDVLKNGNENIAVRRAKPDFTGFVGSFTGHVRTMVVNGDGLVFESASSIDSKGESKPLADVTYQLSEPRVEKGVARADAVVTKVKIYDRKAFKGKRIPKVGDTGVFRLEKGVVRSPYIGKLYCDGKAAKKGTCG